MVALPALMAIILPLVHFLPQRGDMAPSAIAMDLPDQLGDWTFQHKPPSDEEVELLADDTVFSKATCFSPRAGEYTAITRESIPDRIDLSVVFSGHDLNNSIHPIQNNKQSKSYYSYYRRRKGVYDTATLFYSSFISNEESRVTSLFFSQHEAKKDYMKGFSAS